MLIHSGVLWLSWWLSIMQLTAVPCNSSRVHLARSANLSVICCVVIYVALIVGCWHSCNPCMWFRNSYAFHVWCICSSNTLTNETDEYCQVVSRCFPCAWPCRHPDMSGSSGGSFVYFPAWTFSLHFSLRSPCLILLPHPYPLSIASRPPQPTLTVRFLLEHALPGCLKPIKGLLIFGSYEFSRVRRK